VFVTTEKTPVSTFRNLLVASQITSMLGEHVFVHPKKLVGFSSIKIVGSLVEAFMKQSEDNRVKGLSQAQKSLQKQEMRTWVDHVATGYSSIWEEEGKMRRFEERLQLIYE